MALTPAISSRNAAPQLSVHNAFCTRPTSASRSGDQRETGCIDVLAVLLLEPLAERERVAAHPVEVGARREPSDGIPVVRGARGFCREQRARKPHICVRGKVEAFRHHADDLKLFSVGIDVQLRQVRLGAEQLAPQRVADHGDVRIGAAFGTEAVAQRRVHAEHIEELAGHGTDVPARAAVAADDQVSAAGVLGDRGEAMQSVAQVAIVQIGQRHRLAVAVDLVEGDQLLRVRVWQGAQQDGIGDRQDRDCRAEPERQRGDGKGAEAGPADQQSQRE